jgi:hypothetical protein
VFDPPVGRPVLVLRFVSKPEMRVNMESGSRQAVFQLENGSMRRNIKFVAGPVDNNGKITRGVYHHFFCHHRDFP